MVIQLILLNTSADVAADTAKRAIDTAEGTIPNVGDLTIKASKDDINLGARSELDTALSMKTINNATWMYLKIQSKTYFSK